MLKKIARKRSFESEQSQESIILKELEILKSKIGTKKISLEEARTQYYKILAKCPTITSNQLDRGLKNFEESFFEIYRDEKFKEGNLIFAIQRTTGYI